jgi:hypothetical protein
MKLSAFIARLRTEADEACLDDPEVVIVCQEAGAYTDYPNTSYITHPDVIERNNRLEIHP